MILKIITEAHAVVKATFLILFVSQNFSIPLLNQDANIYILEAKH